MIYLGTSFLSIMSWHYFVVRGFLNLLLIRISNSIFLHLSCETQVELGIMIFVISPLDNYLNLKRRGPWACCKEKRRRRPKGEKRLISIKINNHKRRRSSKKNIKIGYMIMLPAMFSKSLINSIEKKLSISYVVFFEIYTEY